MINGVECCLEVKQYQGSRFASRQEQMNFVFFLWREELSQWNDLFCMQTDTDCLNYGHKYVPTAALQPLIQVILI